MPFTLPPFCGWCTVMWMMGGGSDMDAGAAAPEGGPHGWLFGEHHVGGGGFSSWSCGRQEV